MRDEQRVKIDYLYHLHTGGHWSTIENQKRFFDKFAQDKELDPLNPNDWYNVNYFEISEAVC